MDLEQRIAQFENMAQADPGNEMAHFSLAGAYAQAGRHADAADAYRRAIEAQPELSKAFQLGAEQALLAGDRPGAEDLLNRGYEVAARNGDLMPKNAIAEKMAELGLAVPEVEGAAEVVIPEGSFIDRKSGRPGTEMEAPPFRGPIGEWIRENISAETFEEWIGQGTKVINELRLDLSRDEDSDTYDRYMHEFFGLTDDDVARLRAGEKIGAD